MGLSTLSNLFKRHLWLQTLFAYLPCLLVLIYAPICIWDLSRLVSIFSYNDNIALEDLSFNLVREVADYSYIDENKTQIQVKGIADETVDVEVGDLVYQLRYFADNYYQIETCSDMVYAVSNSDVYKEGNYANSDIVCSVYVTESGFRIDYLDGTSEERDTLASATVVLKTGDSVRVNISAGYFITVDNASLNYCTILPTDVLYYDEATGQFVQNATRAQMFDYLIESRILIILGACIVYSLLIGVLGVHDSTLTVIADKRTRLCNIIGVGVLTAVLGLIFLMFS